VGAGVVGLTCALRLVEAGHSVRVMARERLAATTSGVAAAVWFPYRALPYDRVLAWSRTSYHTFAALTADRPEAGVRLRSGVELVRDEGPEPWWAGAVPDLVRETEVPAGYAFGWRFTAPVVDMSRYLPWLEGRLAGHGVVPEEAAICDFDGLDAPVVVDCAGLGARELVPDASLTPVRGQVVVVGQVGVDEWVVDDQGRGVLTFVVPRIDDIVVGGTADEGAEDLSVDRDVAEDILRRATALVPALSGAPVRGHRVGLRPARPAVRLDAERRHGRTVVHCYGHGGAGVTLSWGCADEVAGLVGAASR
jgi:D-amino-acid oxidase